MSLHDTTHTTHTTQTPATPARASSPAREKVCDVSKMKAIPPHLLTAQDKADIADVEQSLKDIKSGKIKTIPLEQVKKNLGL